LDRQGIPAPMAEHSPGCRHPGQHPVGAATEADRAGVPREKTKRLLGHSQVETTEIYPNLGA
jgi:hypothetical protein